MKINAILFWILSIFFGALSVIYALWTMLDYGAIPNQDRHYQAGVEWVGTVALALTSVLSMFFGFYFQRTYNAQGGELPEDRADADIDDGEAEQGHFSPWSWWPLMLGASAGLFALGLAVGVWIIAIAVAAVIVSLIGWQFEYYRGNFGR